MKKISLNIFCMFFLMMLHVAAATPNETSSGSQAKASDKKKAAIPASPQSFWDEQMRKIFQKKPDSTQEKKQAQTKQTQPLQKGENDAAIETIKELDAMTTPQAVDTSNVKPVSVPRIPKIPKIVRLNKAVMDWPKHQKRIKELKEKEKEKEENADGQMFIQRTTIQDLQEE